MLTSPNTGVSSDVKYYYEAPRGAQASPLTAYAPRAPAPAPAPAPALAPMPVRLPPISSLVGPPASYVPVTGPAPSAGAPPRMVVAAAEAACAGAGASASRGSDSLDCAARLRKQCPVCGKVCSRPSTLKTHFLIHTGDTPFKCTWRSCNKSFNVKSNMLRHLKSHERKQAKKQGERVSL